MSYLQNLQEEFTANRRILWEMRTYIDGGPPILEVLEPADMAAAHLRFTAWDSLIRAGVLANLTPAEQALFRVTDRAGRKAAQDVQTLAATWRRFLAWQEWTRKQKEKDRLVQTWPDQSMLHQVQRQIKESLGYAIERSDEALATASATGPPVRTSPETSPSRRRTPAL